MTNKIATKIKQNQAVGTFGKGNENSHAVNFNTSAGPDCSLKCRLNPNNRQTIARKLRGENVETCYAVRNENYRKNVKNLNRLRGKTNPVTILSYASVKLSKVCNSWVRFSTHGSLPMISRAKSTRGFIRALENFCERMQRNNNKIHLPIEEIGKARFYRDIVGKFGFIVRLSCQSETQALDKNNAHRSYVVGTREQSRAERKIAAYDFARKIRENGETAIVCPAIVSKAKCGDCTACASDKVAMVVYPLH